MRRNICYGLAVLLCLPLATFGADSGVPDSTPHKIASESREVGHEIATSSRKLGHEVATTSRHVSHKVAEKSREVKKAVSEHAHRAAAAVKSKTAERKSTPSTPSD